MSDHNAGDSSEPLREIHRDVGRLFEQFAPLYALRVARQFPAVNIYDAPDRYILTAELPGITAAEFELSMTGDAVTIRGARHRDPNIRDDSFRRQERPFGHWSRTINLPSKIDADRVSASLALGILTVDVPKAEERRTRPIAVTMVNP